MSNQEQYELICEKAKKYDRLVEVFDKIRAEIEALEKPYRIHMEDEYEGAWNDAIDLILDIIDKYRKEQE